MLYFWQKVKEELRTQGITQKELAENLDIPERTVTGWIHKNRLPSLNGGVEIADYLGLDVKYLLGYSDKNVSEEKSRWKFWIEETSDEDLRVSRTLLTSARHFLHEVEEQQP